MPNRVALPVFLVSAFSALLMAGSAVAVWAGPNDASPEFHRTPDGVFPGGLVSVSGRGCSLDGRRAQRARVHLTRLSGLDGKPPYGLSKTYLVGENGDWSGEFVVPNDAPPGRYRMSATCEAGDMVWNGIDTDFSVYDPTAPPTTARSTTTEAPPRTTSSSSSSSMSAAPSGVAAPQSPSTTEEVDSPRSSTTRVALERTATGGSSWLVTAALIAGLAVLAASLLWSRRSRRSAGSV